MLLQMHRILPKYAPFLVTKPRSTSYKQMTAIFLGYIDLHIERGKKTFVSIKAPAVSKRKWYIFTMDFSCPVKFGWP